MFEDLNLNHPHQVSALDTELSVAASGCVFSHLNYKFHSGPVKLFLQKLVVCIAIKSAYCDT